MNRTLCDKLIVVYQWAILECGEIGDMDEIRDYLLDNRLNKGICYLASCVFDEDLYHDKWIGSKIKTPSGYISEQPRNCRTKREIIQSLQTRLDILLTFTDN